MKQMEDTRSALTEKLEVLETKVADKAAPVAQAVERVTAATADIVADVKETIHEVAERVQEVTDKVHQVTETVTEKVEQVSQTFQETVQSVSNSFSLKRQTEEHPWLVVGLAATAGCIAGSLGGGNSGRTHETFTAPAPSSSSHAKHGKNGGNGWHRKKESSQSEGLFTEEMRRVKTLVISAALGFMRDLAKQGIPGTLGTKLAEEIDTLTTRLGAEPLREPVIARDANKGTDSSATGSEPVVNRMRGETF